MGKNQQWCLTSGCSWLVPRPWPSSMHSNILIFTLEAKQYYVYTSSECSRAHHELCSWVVRRHELRFQSLVAGMRGGRVVAICCMTHIHHMCDTLLFRVICMLPSYCLRHHNHVTINSPQLFLMMIFIISSCIAIIIFTLQCVVLGLLYILCCHTLLLFKQYYDWEGRIAHEKHKETRGMHIKTREKCTAGL